MLKERRQVFLGLFNRRPLSLFCLLFIVIATISAQIAFEIKIWILAGLSAALLLCIALYIIFKKQRTKVLFAVLCLVAMLAALLNVALRIDLPSRNIEKYEGKYNAAVSIVDREYSSRYADKYVVYVDNIDGEDVHIKSVLTCASGTALSIGDVLYAEVEITPVKDGESENRYLDNDTLLNVVLDEQAVGIVNRFDYEAPLWERIFARNGLYVTVFQMRELVSDRSVAIFGEEMDGMVKGFLIGDTSDMSTETLRDFRRTGVSHLFAVSGMHITVLLGFVELILRKLYVHKIGRMAAVWVLSIGLLCLTGFSMSALRSVFMLWIAYIAFLFSEESDAPTTLFIAVSLTMIIFPYSVYELGLWMSFLATLGLVTVYPIVDEAIRLPKKENILFYISFRALKAIAMTAIMTLISTMFLLPIQWYFFGELSLVSVPANMLLSPISTVFMVLGLISMVLGGIPYLGAVGIGATSVLGKAMIWISNKLSSLSMATVSLRYSFAWILVVLFAIALIVLLVVKLKHKWLICIPFVAFSLALGIGVVAYNEFAPSDMTYYKNGNGEIVSITSEGKTSIVDMSSGAYDGFSHSLADSAKHGATQVDSIIFTKITKSHISTMEYFLRRNIVKSIYIPMPDGSSDVNKEIELAELANSLGVAVYLYENGDPFSVGGVTFGVGNFSNGEQTGTAVFVYGREEAAGYIDECTLGACAPEVIDSFTSACDKLIVSGKQSDGDVFSCKVLPDATVIYTSEDVARRSRIELPLENSYFISKKYQSVSLAIK